MPNYPLLTLKNLNEACHVAAHTYPSGGRSFPTESSLYSSLYHDP